jgi:hypothetical protein
MPSLGLAGHARRQPGPTPAQPRRQRHPSRPATGHPARDTPDVIDPVGQDHGGMAGPTVVRVPRPVSLLVSAFDAGTDSDLPIDIQKAPGYSGRPDAAPKSAGIGTYDSSSNYDLQSPAGALRRERPSGHSPRGHRGIGEARSRCEPPTVRLAARQAGVDDDGPPGPGRPASAGRGDSRLGGYAFTATLTDHTGNSIEFFGTKALARFLGTTIMRSP